MFNVGDKIKPSKSSPFIGTIYEEHDFKVVEIKNEEQIIVLRNGWHYFLSMNCYFLKN